MIAGAGMLIAVAVEAGTIEALSTWIGSNVPKPLVPIAFCLVGATMSFFSSTTGVVAPALFPLIPNLAASVGLKRAGIICLHDPWCPVQRYQSIFFRRFPDPWFHPERGRTQ